MIIFNNHKSYVYHCKSINHVDIFITFHVVERYLRNFGQVGHRLYDPLTIIRAVESQLGSIA